MERTHARDSWRRDFACTRDCPSTPKTVIQSVLGFRSAGGSPRKIGQWYFAISSPRGRDRMVKAASRCSPIGPSYEHTCGMVPNRPPAARYILASFPRRLVSCQFVFTTTGPTLPERGRDRSPDGRSPRVVDFVVTRRGIP